MNYNRYYNLDTNVKSIFDNTRVLNALARNEIETLWDLYCTNEDRIANSSAVGNQSMEIIHKAYEYLEYLYNLSFNIDKINEIMKPYLKRKVLVSVNSDNQLLSETISLERLLWIYNNEYLSDRDKINTNAVIKYLTDNLIKINTNDASSLVLESFDEYVDTKPFDTISPTIARFNDDKEAYQTLSDIINSFPEEKADMFMMYYGMFQHRNTLEAIGQKYNLTRERVRQINSKTFAKVLLRLDDIRYKIMNYFQNDFYIPFENPLLMIYCEYLKEKGIYVKKKVLGEDVYALVNYSNDFDDLINSVEMTLEREGLYQFEENFDSKKILKLFSKKYKINDGIIYGKNTLISSIPKVMAEINRPVDLNSQNDVEMVYNMLESKYNVKSAYHDSRSLERVISGTCILVDNRTFIHEKHIRKLNSINQIFDYIEKSKITNAQTIFEVYKSDWESIEIYSHIGVYGYIKYFYPDKYNYGGRSFLISLPGENSAWGSEVIDRIKKYNRPVSYNEMHSIFPAISDTIWINLENIFTDLIFWGDNTYYCISSLELSSQEKNLITMFMFNKKIVSDKDLYIYIMNENKDILEMYNINNEKQLQKLVEINLGDVIHFNGTNNTFYI